MLQKIEDFIEWNSCTQIQARAQRVENVMDPKYTATTPEETLIFHAQKDYMSAVFDRILVLVEGQSILCEMGSKPDPQVATPSS